MDINHFIAEYGYWALFIGCLAEGETVTLLGGLAAHEGLLRYWAVVAVVALGGIAGDQLLYFIGRSYGTAVLRRFKQAQPNIERANRLILRHPRGFVIGVRFMYGFRLIGPLLIGASRLPPAKFVPLNILGAVAWALIFVTLGYLGGQVIAPWLEKVDHHLKFGLLAVAALVLVWLVPRAVRYVLRRRRR
ncbi:DedA family protein [Sodalis sp. RH21]|uniref:DedA family protein n=1 Tax=unclassified Sodalis (in: enterobacteria) TaxID=2636512 RepID=UPI0039B64378